MPFFPSSLIRRPQFRLPSVPAPARSVVDLPPPKSVLPKGGLAPIHLFGEVDVDPGSEASVRSASISNRAGTTIEIREIRFTGFTAVQSTALQIDGGMFLRARISIDDRKITNSFVPVWLLGKTEQIETQSTSFLVPGSEGRVIYTWRLAKPWVIKPKNEITVSFQHSGALRQMIRGQIGFVGRVIDRAATTTAVPYAAAYVSKSFGYSSLDYDESSEQDLSNIVGRAVTIDRISGRVAVTANLNVANQPSNYSDRNAYGQVEGTLIRLDGSNGSPIVRDYASFRTVFGMTRSLDGRFDLNPGEFLRARIKNIAGPALGGSAYVTYYSQAHIAIIGSREEVI